MTHNDASSETLTLSYNTESSQLRNQRKVPKRRDTEDRATPAELDDRRPNLRAPTAAQRRRLGTSVSGHRRG